MKCIANAWDHVTAWFARVKYFLFTPSNRLHIRNIPRGFVDRSGRVLHAMFSLLCDYVELEIGGEKCFRERLAMLYRNSKPDSWERRAYNHESKILALYIWYRRVNWQDPVPVPQEALELDKKRTNLWTPLANPEEEARYVELMDQWIRAEDKFQNICVKRMHSLVTLSPFLWT